MKYFVSSISFISFLIIAHTATTQVRTATELRFGWKFFKGSVDNASQVDFNDSDWRDVVIPHDWAVGEPFIVDGDGNTGKLPWKGEGWYRKSLNIPAEYRDKRIYLLFDGIMAFPEIFINGKPAGRWDYGYNSFYLDITDYV